MGLQSCAQSDPGLDFDRDVLALIKFDIVLHIKRFAQGPLQTRAKSHGQELVRVQNKVSKLKPVPKHLQNHVVWSWALKCTVKSYVTRPSTKCYSSEFIFMHVLTHDKIE